MHNLILRQRRVRFVRAHGTANWHWNSCQIALRSTMKTVYSKYRRSIQLVLGRAISLRSDRKDHFMKTRIFVGLCVALGASFISARADDTPSPSRRPRGFGTKAERSGQSANPAATGTGHTFRSRGGTTRQIRNQRNPDDPRKSGDSANRSGGNNSSDGSRGRSSCRCRPCC